MFLRASHFESTYTIRFHLAFMPKISQCSSATDKGSKSLHVKRAPGSCQCSQPLSHTNLWTASLDGIWRSPGHAGWAGSPVPHHWGMLGTSPPMPTLLLTPHPPRHSSGSARAANSSKACGHLQGLTESRLEGVHGENHGWGRRQQENILSTQVHRLRHWFISSVQKHQQQLHQS